MIANNTQHHQPGQSAKHCHPKGSKARVLLTSVFGPYAQDDEYGSRKMNPMELYQNQVTRTQGPFSLRMFHRSWGLMLIQSNIQAPCVVLDFPVLERFIEELKTEQYDIIGISGIVLNQGKIAAMCELIRRYQPGATIVIGGHVANVPDLMDKIDADHIVRGEGVAWFRKFLGEDADQPLRHPYITSGIGTRNVGIAPKEGFGKIAATVIPSVGCPLGCNFCSTSAMFGGKGKSINFYESGDDLYHVMSDLEEKMGVQSFFVMDENFLFYKKRAMRLLELMEENNKAWALYVFSSAKVIRSYSLDELIRLGISWVWMGLDGESSQYSKLDGIDTFELVSELQSNGIRVLGSSIIGLEEHTPENIDEAIAYSVRHNTAFHQFMLYTPIPGTPLHAELSAKGMMKNDDEFDPGDIHGQDIFNYHHASISDEQAGQYMIRAFDQDFEINGPSVPRIVRSTLDGWLKHKDHPDPRIRRRYQWEAAELATDYAAVVKASQLYFRKRNPAIYKMMTTLLKDLYAAFGWKARFYGEVGGRWVHHCIKAEERRMNEGWTYEPPTFYERNEHVTDRTELPIAGATAAYTSQQKADSVIPRPHISTTPNRLEDSNALPIYSETGSRVE